MGIRIYWCLASLEGAPGGSPAGGGGGGAEAAMAPPEPGGHGGGGTWPRRVSVGTWRTAAAEAAGAGGGGGSGGGIPLACVGHRLGQLRVGEERMRKKEKGKRGAHGLLDQDPTAVHVG
jgi:hypothetical protein